MRLISSSTAHETPKAIDLNWSDPETVKKSSPKPDARTKRVLGGATLRLLCCIALIFLPTHLSVGQDTLTDTTTGKQFPKTISFFHQGTQYTLSITGLAVRKKFFLSVYSIAHYMQDAPRSSVHAVLQAVLDDGTAKQVTMDFVRDISAERIRASLVEGFQKNTTDSEFEEIQPLVRRFARAIYKDVKQDDRFTIRWLPGGTTVSIFQGEEVSRIRSVTFATALWSIWFGERSVVDRNKLVRLLAVNP